MADYPETDYFALGPDVAVELSLFRLVHSTVHWKDNMNGGFVDAVSTRLVDLCRHIRADCLMKVLSYDVLYSTVKAVCEMSIPADAFHGMPDVDHFITTIKGAKAQNALKCMGHVLSRSLKLSTESLWPYEPTYIVTTENMSTALHHLMSK